MLLELLIAMAIFVLFVSAVGFLISDVFVSDRSARERTEAMLLSQEGIEAVRSIRNMSWQDVAVGTHGIEVSGGEWNLTNEANDLSGELSGGTREIIIEEIDADRKKVTSRVSWSVLPGRSQDVELVTRLTNWSEGGAVGSCSQYCSNNGYDDGVCRQNSNQCRKNGETYEVGGDEYCSGTGGENVCCCQ